MAVTNASGVAITSQTDIANLQPFRYRGYYYDYESGFYYLQSRYYDSVTHGFINADGLVSTGTGVLGFNMFAYCENNSVNQYDSDGLCGDPTCVKCNPFWREYISDPKNLAWNKKVNPNFKINNCSVSKSNNNYVSYQGLSSKTASFTYEIDFSSMSSSSIKTYGVDFKAKILDIVQDVNLRSAQKIKLNHFQRAELWGETMVHFWGYELSILFDAQETKFYNKVSKADLEIDINGYVIDKRNDGWGPFLNATSLVTGQLFYSFF